MCVSINQRFIVALDGVVTRIGKKNNDQTSLMNADQNNDKKQPRLRVRNNDVNFYPRKYEDNFLDHYKFEICNKYIITPGCYVLKNCNPSHVAMFRAW